MPCPFPPDMPRSNTEADSMVIEPSSVTSSASASLISRTVSVTAPRPRRRALSINTFRIWVIKLPGTLIVVSSGARIARSRRPSAASWPCRCAAVRRCVGVRSPLEVSN